MWWLQRRHVRKVLLHGVGMFGALSFLLPCYAVLQVLLLLGWFGLSWWFPMQAVSKKTVHIVYIVLAYFQHPVCGTAGIAKPALTQDSENSMGQGVFCHADASSRSKYADCG